MQILLREKLPELAAALAGQGYRVVAPVADTNEGQVRYGLWSPGLSIRTDAVPVNSIKEFLFPCWEVIGRAACAGDSFDLKETRPEAVRTVILAARPCDVAALRILDAVFNWDYRDAFYNARREATSIVALACGTADEHCFCTSVGGRPDQAPGADVVLRPAEQGRQLVCEAFSDGGRQLLAGAGSLLAQREAVFDPAPQLGLRRDFSRSAEKLASRFESPRWVEASLGCLGCGACAYACPACHCFDIQDESDPRGSVRLRTWDACGFGLFTLHAGGHNPRPDQTARWRQRIMHKFSYFPQRFQMPACTGCGRCSRTCQAGMSPIETLEKVLAD